MKTRTSVILLALAVLGLVAVQPARAGTLYWDTNGTTAGTATSSTGTWGTNNYWSTSSDGTIATGAWTAGETAVFAAGINGTGYYTVTVSGTQDIGGLTFEEGTVTISGGTALRLVSNAIVDVASGRTAGVSTVISENTAGRTLTKTGAGTLTLSGVNTYTGATTISAGTLRVGADANLGNANSLVFDGGTLQVTGTTLTSYASGLIGTHAVTLTAAKTVGLDINNASNTFTVSQVLNQTTGGLTKAGPGTLILSGANTYTGNTAVNQGFLQLSPSGAITMLVNTISQSVGAAANFNPGSGVIQTTTGTNGIIGGWATYGTNDWAIGSPDGTTLTTVTAATYTDTATALDVPAKYTNNNMNVNSSQTPTDAITPNSLRFNTAAPYTLTLQGSNTITSGGILVGTTVGDNLSKITGGTLTNGTELIVTQNNAGNSLEIGSAITGGGAVTKWGAGTLTLSGTNTYTGGTRINGGMLSTGSLPTSTSSTTGMVAFNNGGILEYTSASSGTVYLDDAPGASNSDFAINVTNAGGNLTVRRGEGGVGAGISYNNIVKGGPGTLTLANANFDDGGDVVVNEGTVVLAGAPNWLYAFNTVGAVTDVKPGAILKFGKYAGDNTFHDGQIAVITGRQLHMTGGTCDLNGAPVNTVPAVEGSGLITNSASGTTAVAKMFVSYDTEFSGNIGDGAGKVAVTVGATAEYNTGTPTGKTWTLSGNNTYSGATSVALAGGVILKAGSTTAFSPNSVFTIGAAGQTGTVDLAGFNNTIAGLTTAGTAASQIVKNSVVGTAILTVNNDATTSNADYTFGGVLRDGTVGEGGGQLGLTKTGSKTLTLTGANTYTGDTTVSAGILEVTTAFFDDLSTVYISSGALLDLNHAWTDTISYLYLAGVMQPTGVYNTLNTPTLSGTGSLNVLTPEPATMALLAVGGLGLILNRKRK